MSVKRNTGSTGVFAGFYDALNDREYYSVYADFILRTLKDRGVSPGSHVLDLACGTGEMSVILKKSGYRVCALDISSEMLTEASTKAYSEGIDDILFTCQDMRDFSLYSKTDAVVCIYDSLNHLMSRGDIVSAFSHINAAMSEKGCFIFDMSTKHRYADVYADNTFTVEDGDVFCVWENAFDEKRNVCDFLLTFFKERPDGLYERYEERQKQKYYPENFIIKALTDAGFINVVKISDTDVFGSYPDAEVGIRDVYVAEKA